MKRNNDVLIRLLLGIATIAVALTPTWGFLFVRASVSPEGFWQTFALYGAGLFFLGGIQVVFLIVAVRAIFYLITEW